MAIDPNYVLASGLDEYFVDKDTGFPLAEGTLTFWSDDNRSNPKNVFTISGTPPNYTYVNLGSTITLNSTGTPVDESGNSVVIYYYPYDVDGNVDLYYVECYSSEDVLQFTREAWPNSFVPDLTVQQTDNIPNFVPNGQFRLHNNIPANPAMSLPAGRITLTTTEIAPGGWEFEATNGSGASTGTYEVNFVRFGEYVSNPTASPRFTCQVQCLASDPSADRINLQLKFNDVNKFASDTQQYTFSFTANTYQSSNFTVGLYTTKKFGTGGSPSAEENTLITQFTITGTSTLFQHSFVFGANTGTQVGTNNDDVLYLIIGFPHNITFGAQLTDFMLVEGPVDVVSFPPTTDGDFIARSMIPPVPSPDGFDLYLPILCAPTGYIFDHSIIGKVFPTTYAVPAVGELLCNGAAYLTATYSSDGIPYARLQNVFMQAANAELPLFGTGLNYASASSVHGATTSFLLTTNSSGTQTAISDGSPGTGFTFNSISAGAADIGLSSYVYGAGNSIWIYNEAPGGPINDLPNSAGTSPFTVHPIPLSGDGEIPGTPVANQLLSVIMPSLPTAGQYFEVTDPNSGYYIWYRVNGSGSDPAIAGYLGIRVDIYTGMDIYDVAYATACAISSFQIYEIIPTSGSSVTPNSYFNFYANGTHYYVWMNLNGGGTDPAISSATGISVSYQSTYSQTQMKNAIVKAIDSLYFAVPDLRGGMIKGWDPTGTIDLNAAYRYSMNRYQPSTISLPNYIGSQQFGTLLSHQHNSLHYNVGAAINPTITYTIRDWRNPIGGVDAEIYNLIEASGTAQNDVKNVYLNYVIKY